MPSGSVSNVVRRLRGAALMQDGGGMTDGQLLECFLTGRDEAAFEVLVRRHGSMVLGVCRRILKHAQDAEDAFQATFLVLVRKAASLLPRQTVGNWLYGVAYHTALKARAASWKRRTKEMQVRNMPGPDAQCDLVSQDAQPVLLQELNRLPEKYREPVVLCDLQGMTRREAARQLGIPEGTLSGRLTTARRILAERLSRHGVALSATALAMAVSQTVASASLRTPLVDSTIEAATVVAAAGVATSVISTKVAALTEGVLQAMMLIKLKAATAIVVAVAIAVTGVAVLSQRALAEKPAAVNQQDAAKPAPVNGDKSKPDSDKPEKQPDFSGQIESIANDGRTI